jgi:uncharacterized membrane-anchored protein
MPQFSRLVCLAACLTIASSLVHAQDDKAAAFEKSLNYRSGVVSLHDGVATIRVPESFRFLDQESSRRLLVQGWGNPPAAADDVLGMLVPAAVSPLADEGWGIVISYEQDGYVSDDDAGEIDYAQLLKDMRDETKEANKERSEQGFGTVELIGWAEPPSYDRASHKLYWAKELAFSDLDEHTLNYSIRILGRRGVLVLNAVSSMSQLPAMKTATGDVLAAVDFNEGHRYTDYLPGTDKTAAYGLTGLIVGATAAKAGVFKMIWLTLLAFKKLLIVGAVALLAVLKRLFSGKQADTTVPPPLPRA